MNAYTYTSSDPVPNPHPAYPYLLAGKLVRTVELSELCVELCESADGDVVETFDDRTAKVTGGNLGVLIGDGLGIDLVDLHGIDPESLLE